MANKVEKPSRALSEANSKKLVLRKKSEFQLIKIKGKRKAFAPWVMVSYLPNQEEHFRFGLTISTKVGNAVLRNRLKRWCREFFRKKNNEENFPKIDFNLIFRQMPGTFYKDLEFSEFQHVLEKGFEKIF